ncbi:lipid-binding putative hydrolase [Chitinophaga niastensis]|uniref:Lipid-binding putative hydrolase n=1 Tax=Chitinophaga niastensis TaxID=536980 RepID=A0A2P8HMM4_CHINA|nr:lipid-binding protein [Chitinophaga niastensis]PSL47478.1 lipid-binding putative hydrolase [Chitinophaga niastensis]
MITIMHKRYLTGILMAAAFVFSFSSCKKELPVVGNTAVVKMAGTWWVTMSLNGAPQLAGKHAKINTFNATADDGKELWIQDTGDLGFGFQSKANVNLADLTFTATNAKDVNSAATVTITAGKVFTGQGKSKGGHVTDSIYMELQISSNPGNKYVVSGILRTKFDEDDY